MSSDESNTCESPLHCQTKPEGLKDFNLKENTDKEEQKSKTDENQLSYIEEMFLRLMREQSRHNQDLMEKVFNQRTLIAQPLNLADIPSIRISKLNGNENQETVEKFLHQVTSESTIRGFSEIEKIKLAEYNLEGEIRKWYDENEGWNSLGTFAEALKKKCKEETQDNTAHLDLIKLMQIGYLSKYVEQFEELKNKITTDYASADFFRDVFILGLQEPLRTYVRLQHPTTWHLARDWAIAEDTKNRKIFAAKSNRFKSDRSNTTSGSTNYNGNNYRNNNNYQHNNRSNNRSLTSGTKKA